MKNTNSKIDKNTLSNENYKQTELGELPESWEVVTLGEVIIPDRIKIKAKDYSGNEKIVEKIPFNTGKIVLREKKETGTDLYKSGKNRLLISKINFHQGAVAITNETVVATTHYDFFKVLPNSDILFFWYYLRSSVFKDLFVNEIKFRGYKKEANYNFIKDFKIPLPPLLEQKKIAYVLSTVQEAQEKTEKYISALKEFKKSMMKHLFTYGAVNPKDINKVELKETEIGYIPKHWEVVRLGDVLMKNLRFKISELNRDSKVCFIPMAMIPEDNLYINNWEIRKFKDIRSGIIVYEGDLLIAKITPCFENGKQGILKNIPNGYAYATTEVIPIRTNSLVLSTFLAYYLKDNNIRYKLTQKMEGTTGRKRLPKSQIENLQIPIPPLSEQEYITSILSSIDERIEAAEKKKEALKELFNSLLKNLMTAKIRVNNIEEVN